MITEQSYVGRATSATTSPQTAQNAAKSSFTTDYRQQAEVNPKTRKGDPYGRSGRVQILHIDLYYLDGTQGEINVTSPHIGWGADIESQWASMHSYIRKNYQALGIARYQAHVESIRDNQIRNVWSWRLTDAATGTEVLS